MKALSVLDRWYCDRLGWGRTAGSAAGTWRERSAANLCLQGHKGACARLCLCVSVFVEDIVVLIIYNLSSLSSGRVQ